MERATRAIIDLSAIGHNIRAIRTAIGPSRHLMAVVKADAYGHGAVQVSRTALKNGADRLGVALPEEGGALRSEGIHEPILVLGMIHPKEASKVARFGLSQTVCTGDLAKALDQVGRASNITINVHVKVDTGMGRLGVAPEEALPFVHHISRFKHLSLKGIFSHLPCADEPDKTFTKRQIQQFHDLVREIEATGTKIPVKHLANSAGILDFPRSYGDLVRPGIMIYGLYPSAHVSRGITVKPAMTLKTRIAYLKRVCAGTPISYGHTFRAPDDMRIATLAVGYGDGYSRGLSNRGCALIRNVTAPIVGRVCMDMCMVDVSHIPDVRDGDEAVLFGETPPVDELARRLDTINYEIVCAVGKRVPRMFV